MCSDQLSEETVSTLNPFFISLTAILNKVALLLKNPERYTKAIGIDGCRYGWVSASYDDGQVLLFRTISELLSYYGENNNFMIDMPIGLSNNVYKPRTCEKAARAILLPKRKSTIFPVPCREVLDASNYEDASRINRAILGCGISKQSWFITPKIKELDLLLTAKPGLIPRIKESHPEIAFQFLNREQPLQYSKKSPRGITERLQILTQFFGETEKIFEQAIHLFKRSLLAKDDILDSLCLAVVAASVSQRSDLELFSFNSIPPIDNCGIEMAIYYAKVQKRV